MNRTYIAIFLVLLIISICTFTTSSLKTTVDYMTSKLDEIEILVINNNILTANEACNDLSKYWKKHEIFLTSCVHHTDINNISSNLARLNIMLQYSDEYGIILGDLCNIRITLENILKNQYPTVENLL